jgi:hypothetical protein
MVIEEYFSLICVALVGVNLLYGRHRAAALVESGRVTSYELNSFAWSTFVLVGGAFTCFWIIEQVARTDILCLIVFPPRRAAQLAGWLIQATLSGTTVFWLWARNGADILARLAPAFTSGPVLGREFSSTRVKWLISAFVVVGPLLAILTQLSHPGMAPGCEKV